MTIKINIQNSISDVVAQKIRGFVPKTKEGLMRTIATTMLPVIRTRIHEQGLAADGSDIGQYDKTTPLYVNPLNSPKSFPVKGKTGKTKFEKTGLPHRTRYFESYNEFKTYIGRNELGKVNLSLSGQLASQFVTIATTDGYGLGWPDDEKYNRAKFFEDTKYRKPIWALTAQEQEMVPEIVYEYINNSFGPYAFS